MSHLVERYHDISCGHRVYGHESKCRHLHGHNYRVHFTCTSKDLDDVGRVIDFSVIKAKLCQWLEDNWDHRMLLWNADPIASKLLTMDSQIVLLPFNPTAELLAQYLVEFVAPTVLKGTGVELVKCKIEETRKCSATYVKEDAR